MLKVFDYRLAYILHAVKNLAVGCRQPLDPEALVFANKVFEQSLIPLLGISVLELDPPRE